MTVAAEAILDERWRAVPGYEDLYEVSDRGRVRSLPRVIVTRTGITRRLPGCDLDPFLNDSGYRVIDLRRDRIRKPERVHRLVAFAFIGPPPSPRHEVAHRDGVRTNNCLSNLRWATRAENMSDAVGHGTTNRGERSPLAKLTEEDVREIRKLREAGLLQREIASRFGVKAGTVGMVLRGQNWGYVR